MTGISRPTARPIARSLASPVEGGGGGGVPDPVITVQPVDAVVAIGADATFTVDADGTEPITYQWWEWK